MKKIYLIILSLFVSYTLVTGQSKVPQLDVRDVDSAVHDLSTYGQDGSPKLICLWATWCAPCREELTALHEVSDDLAKKYNLEIIAISIDRERALPRARDMFEKKGWKFDFLSADQKVAFSELGITGVPFSMLVDRDGNILSTQTGYTSNYEKKLEAKLAKLK